MRALASSDGDDDRAKDTSSATYWDIDDIQFHCRVGRTTAWKLVKRHDFPAPVIIGPRGLVWPRMEVIAFMEMRRSDSHYANNSPLVAPAHSFVARPLRGSQS